MSQSEPHKSISTIQTTFARLMDHFGHQLPDDDVLHRRRGRIGDPEDGDYGRGDTVYYLFGQDDQGEYLDFYMAHRIAGDQHGRIREDGSIEWLEVVSPLWPGGIGRPGRKCTPKGRRPGRSDAHSCHVEGQGLSFQLLNEHAENDQTVFTA